MKERFCEKYFEGKVKPKHMQEFEAETPQCNIIRGYLCRKQNEYLESLVIAHIKEKIGKSYDTEQFVQSFPKIHYWDNEHKLKETYLKIKPHDIEAEAGESDRVPRRFILKEVQKYFDEYGFQVREIYEKDDTHYMKYVKFQLKEEFSYEQIQDPITIRRIKNIFMDVWDSKVPPKSLQNICEELVRENPEANIQELMKTFAKTYPSKKRQSRHVFNILSKILKRS